MNVKHNLRFALRKPDRLISSIWRIWTNKNDIYVGVRSLAGDVKTSLHWTGDCQTSFTSQFIEGEKGSAFRNLERSRHVKRWKAVLLNKGLWHLLDVHIPHDRLRDTQGVVETKKKVKWIEPVAKNKNTQFSFFKRDTVPDDDRWVGKNGMGTLLLYRGHLKDGEYFEVVYHGHNEDVNELNKDIKDRLKNYDGSRALQAGVNPDGVGYLIDTPSP